jgi:hypothetical protein
VVGLQLLMDDEGAVLGGWMDVLLLVLGLKKVHIILICGSSL